MNWVIFLNLVTFQFYDVFYMPGDQNILLNIWDLSIKETKQSKTEFILDFTSLDLSHSFAVGVINFMWSFTTGSWTRKQKQA